jgi:predicted PurR-regulated permease PerM
MPAEARERRLIAWGVLFFLGALFLAWILYHVRTVLLLLYVSTLLAIGFSPIVRWLERRRYYTGNRRQRLPRWAAILVLYVGLLGLIAGVLAIIVPPFVAQVVELWGALPSYVDRLQKTLVGYRLITHRYTWSELLKTLPNPQLALTGVVSAVQGVLGALGALVTVVVLPYYLLIEADSLRNSFLRLFAADRRASAASVADAVTVKVGAWLGGQLLLSIIIGVTAALGLWLLGVPYFYVLALLAAIGEFIPVVGPILAAVPAILVALTVSLETGLFTAVYFTVQQFVENHFLVPRVMQKQVGISAVGVIVALLIGTELLGIVGAVLAVPTAAIVQVLFQQYLEREDA